MHINKLGWDRTRSSTKSNTFSRADGVPVVFGHSSRVSDKMKIGIWPARMFLKHLVRAASLGAECHPDMWRTVDEAYPNGSQSSYQAGREGMPIGHGCRVWRHP